MSSKDTDYLHMINLKTAEKLFKEGKYTKINGHAVISMETMVANNALFLIPEPKSPHGVMIDPSGQYLTVSGKLDTHVSVYDFKKMMKLIESKHVRRQRPVRYSYSQHARIIARAGGIGSGTAAYPV